jgi:cytochrome oxidase Cu insertion factor (SCO1/SenC/PrrC family)
VMATRKLLGLTLGLALLIAACQQQPGTTTQATAGSPVKEGSKAPQFVLPSAAGEKMSLAGFRGRKPVLLYFSMGPG